MNYTDSINRIARIMKVTSLQDNPFVLRDPSILTFIDAYLAQGSNLKAMRGLGTNPNPLDALQSLTKHWNYINTFE